MYEVFEHTADLGLRICASTLPELFAEAGRGFSSLIVPNLETLAAVHERKIAVSGDELPLLLFDWLNELLYHFEHDRFVGRDFEVRIENDGLTAICRGDLVDPAAMELDHEVKAITYHHLRVEQTADGWLAEVIVDI